MKEKIKSLTSKTELKSRIVRKTNPIIAETIRLALKNSAWMKLAQILSGSTRNYISVNLKQLDAMAKEGDTIVIPGKVLGSGTLTKKLRLCALSFSEDAKAKMKETKSEAVSILEEIKLNPKSQGVKILR